MRVVLVTTPEAFDMPEMKDLFQRAFEGDQFADAGSAWEMARSRADEEGFGIFVALDGSEFVGLSLFDTDEGVFYKPWILHLYAKGNREARDALAVAMVEFARERGVTRAWALNQSGIDDEKYRDLFRENEPKSRILGSVIEFRLGE